MDVWGEMEDCKKKQFREKATPGSTESSAGGFIRSASKLGQYMGKTQHQAFFFQIVEIIQGKTTVKRSWWRHMGKEPPTQSSEFVFESSKSARNLGESAVTTT